MIHPIISSIHQEYFDPKTACRLGSVTLFEFSGYYTAFAETKGRFMRCKVFVRVCRVKDPRKRVANFVWYIFNNPCFSDFFEHPDFSAKVDIQVTPDELIGWLPMRPYEQLKNNLEKKLAALKS